MRKGRYDAARHAVERLGNKDKLNSNDTVAMMRRVIDMEKSDKSPGYLELFKGTDLRRTAIVCGVYLAQNLTGNLIANQAVVFFERTFACLCLYLKPIYRVLIVHYRGRRKHEDGFRSRSHHLRPSDDLRHAFLDPHHLLWPS